VDRVVELLPGESITAIKNVTINEPFFQGHFPGEPVMPGVLMLEALAQAGLLLGFASVEDREEGTLVFFAGIDNARFKRQVVPGDQLTLKVWYKGGRRKLWKFHAEASVEGQLACSADVLAIPVSPNDR
jgi:3-hydroxyacyl-[acyl-carrier-protein] dehydratase